MPSPTSGGRVPAGLRRALAASLATAALAAVMPVMPIAARGATASLLTRLATPAPAPSAVVPARAQEPPEVLAMFDPQLPDAHNGWRSRVTRVVLLPDSDADVFYAWDSPLGSWVPCTRALDVPEGKHVLYAFARSPEGTVGPVSAWPVKVDYRSRPLVRATAEPDSAAYEGTSFATGTVSVRATVNPAAGTRVTRAGGATRYDTSAILCASRFPTASAVIIATGESFPDALSASGLAGSLRAPILLTRRTSLPLAVYEEILRLSPSRIVIVGGTAAVSEDVERVLRRHAPVVDRYAGPTRYETARAVADEIISREGGAARARMFVARGDMFPDALSLSPYAFSSRAPLLLVKPDGVPDAARAVLSGGVGSIVLAGGTGAVSTQVEAQLASYAPVTRLSGADRYQTSSVAAQWGVDHGLGDWGYVAVATGAQFPDALCGGAVTGNMGGVMLLTPSSVLGAYARSALASNTPDVRDIDIIGGTGAVGEAVEFEIRVMFE